MSNMQPEEYENTGWLSYFSRHKTTYTASDIHKISNELNNVRKNLTATQYAYGELSSELKALKSLQEQQRLVDEYEQRAAASSKGTKSTEKRLKEQADEIKNLKSDLASCRNELSKQIAAMKVAFSEQSKKKGLSGSGKYAAGNTGNSAMTLSLESRIIAAEVQLEQLSTGQTTERLSALEQKVGQLEQTNGGAGDYDARLNALERDFTQKLQDLTNLVVELQRKLAKSEAKQVEMVQRLSAAQTTLYEQLEHRYDEQCGKLRELQVRLSHLGQNDDIDSTFV
ncbi:uncharacterized protein LOC128715138 [Anopheles marshallii]|uniref:uncharacterized protein LOC128715138 n=1 Tax=Anopheles marshallii TaxID=1521116 RepID=UPI00237A6FEC|nr:uncharacterized protein LOC128715138 [Anopheles marshallii]